MADNVPACQQTSPQFLQNLSENKCYDCINCSLLERELKKVHDEITSSQLIVQLLHKEIKNTEMEKTKRITNSAILENVPDETVRSENNWSQVVNKISSNNKRDNPSNKHIQTYPISNGDTPH
jgi:3-methyladenine DNA glycosylase AlkD